MFEKLLNKLGYFKKDKLHYARSVNKRLDEHRETVEDLEKIGFFNKDHWWRAEHMAVQDDYLMRLFFIVYGYFPEEKPTHKTSVRARPEILRKCDLPEYSSIITQHK